MKKNETCTLLGILDQVSVNKGRRDCADCGVMLYESLINLKETVEMRGVILWCGSMT